MSLRELDRKRLLEALELARSSFGLTEPNPRVGCILGDAAGRVFGRGATQEAGGPHAEVMALRDAQAAGQTLRGGTAWVTLEPCAHHGRTPPCCDALIAAGIARCVIAAVDPYPQVAGSGLARLRAAGVDVTLAEPDIAMAAREVNVGFFSRVERSRPWVRLKVASSLDGRVALADGSSKWITGVDARADGHAWRRRASAVLTGIGTVLADDPRLDVRLVATARQPLRVVLDSQLRLPVAARILAPPGGVLVVAGDAPQAAAEALRAAGAEVVSGIGSGTRVDLPMTLALLAQRGVNELHVEAGPRLNGALLEAGLADELLVYMAPMLVGPGQPLATLVPLQALADARRFDLMESVQCGQDLRLRLRARPSTAARLAVGQVPAVSEKLTADTPSFLGAASK